MGDLKLTSASGSVTLSPENVAGTTTITLPSSTATLATNENFTSTGIDDNATSTAITIDSSENVGIGTSSPTQKLEANGNIQVNAYDSNSGAGGYYANGLIIGNAYDAGKSAGDDRNAIVWNERGLDLVFGTSDTARMRIDYNGNMGLGVTPESDWDSGFNGFQIGAGGAIFSGTAANTSTRIGKNVYYNSGDKYINANEEAAMVTLGSAGSIDFKVNNSTSHAADSAISWTTAMTIDNSGNTSLSGSDGSPTMQGSGGGKLALRGRSNSGAIGILQLDKQGDTGNVIDFRSGTTVRGNIGLASDGIRIHTGNAGSIYLGGTAAANALDDYEEGTFTPFFENVTVSSYEYQNGRYTKIGDSVFFHIDIETTVMNNNDSSAINVSGLPFTVATIPNIPVASLGATKGVNVAHPEMFIMSGQSYMLMASFSPSTGDTTSWATYQNLGTTVRLFISGHYKI